MTLLMNMITYSGKALYVREWAGCCSALYLHHIHDSWAETVAQDRQGLIKLERGCAVKSKEGEGISLFSDSVVFSWVQYPSIRSPCSTLVSQWHEDTQLPPSSHAL